MAIALNNLDPNEAELTLLETKREPLVQKIGTDLAGLYYKRAAPNDRLAATLSQPSESLLPVSNGSVYVDLVASGSAATLVEDINELGAESAVAFKNIVSAKIPINQLEAMAQLESLQLAQPVYQPMTDVGAVDNQADRSMRSDTARTTFGVDGTGITVGILSDSYNTLGGEASDIASGDLPPDVLVLDEFDGTTAIDEGRAMAQLIHDIAPEADLQFHTAFEGQASFAQGILDLANAGSDVLVDDVFYFIAPFFQDGIVTQAVDQVVAAGVPFFSSAGNAASQSYESEFRGVTDSTLLSTYLWHDFDPGAGVDTRQAFTLDNGDSFRIAFQWDQPFLSAGGAGAANDMDLFITDAAGNLLLSTSNPNVGGDAAEFVEFQNTTGAAATFNISLGQFLPAGGPTPTRIKYIDFDGETSGAEFFTNSATTFGHSNGSETLSVGAAFYNDTPEFGQSPPLPEPFTSLGGTPILFDTAGNRLGSAEVRDNVDFTAPDGVNNTFFGGDADNDGFPNFFGSSAAAPNAAAVGALLLDLDSTLTPAEIEQALETTAIDMTTPGYDRLTGFGLIQADDALASVTGATVPSCNGKLATGYVDAGTLVGNVFNAGSAYAGDLFSNTDETDSVDDVLVGTVSDDNIWAGEFGSDTVCANAGDDTIGVQSLSASGAFVEAGAGNDFVYSVIDDAANEAITNNSLGSTNDIDLGGGDNRAWFKGGNNVIAAGDNGNNVIGIGTGDDQVTTGDGNDFVYSVGDGGGNNVLSLAGGDNSVFVEEGNYNVTTGAGADNIGLGIGADTVSAGDGDNIVYQSVSGAASGNKIIFTGSGNDYVQVGAGSDLIDAGIGLNTLLGGAGADTFVVRSGAFNALEDFEVSVDLIQLSGVSFDDLSFFQGTGAIASSAFIFVGDEAIAEVANTTVAEIDNAANFA